MHGKDKAQLEPSALLSIYVPNLPRIPSRRNDVYERLSQYGGRAENAKISASDPLIKNNQMTLLPARSKTTDSTFKRAA